uniref:SLC41A/MgtE integral membrane domain-containing protein n=1 Tax=Haptolina ericina TaxID=156174 RepID=A0A7S3AMJ6_9EUKA|mmetsp:Transcript_26491/g.59966  ORF Transcript_26491/g.59966 Transcript_26491/m.59966 type:complete len:112 (+) Transcript_26491:112-447(+)
MRHAAVASEIRMAVALSLVLVVAGFLRVVAFGEGTTDALAISVALFLIVITSVVLGTLLPLLLNKMRVDAAHASTTIQVIMDVLGVTIACTVTPLIYSAVAEYAGVLPALA